MHFTSSSIGLLAGVTISLAYFVLVGYLARSLRTTHRLPVVIGAISGMLGALPAILYSMRYLLDVTA
jgi:uncharacterized protein with PQ loop repeat